MKIFRYRVDKRQTQATIDLIEENIKGKIKLSPIRRLDYLIGKENEVAHMIDIIKNSDTDNQDYNISESNINIIGYELIKQDRNMDALRILKLNTEKYPDDFITHDSYQEILLLTGDKENAIKACEKSLALNPDNENAKKVLFEIK
jgi:tetratricopeptide (TPR) repeat protein